MRYYFEGDEDRSEPVRKTMTLATSLTLRFGAAFRLDLDGQLIGAALLLPPAVRDFPLSAVIAAVLRTPSLWRPRALRRHFGVAASIAAHRPPFPSWVLLSLGIEPAGQHRGHGSYLLEHVLQSLPPRSAICLETDNERNVPLYLRHGFDVASEFVPHDGKGPRTWAMRRPCIRLRETTAQAKGRRREFIASASTRGRRPRRHHVGRRWRRCEWPMIAPIARDRRCSSGQAS